MYVLAVFKNRNETLRFNAQLRNLNINSSVVSTPKGLGSSCSVVVKFYLKHLSKAVYALKSGKYKTFQYMFHIVNDNYGTRYEMISV